MSGDGKRSEGAHDSASATVMRIAFVNNDGTSTAVWKRSSEVF